MHRAGAGGGAVRVVSIRPEASGDATKHGHASLQRRASYAEAAGLSLRKLAQQWMWPARFFAQDAGWITPASLLVVRTLLAAIT